MTLPFSEKVPLAPRTTLRVGGPAAAWAEAQSEAELIGAVRDSYRQRIPYVLLGGGSNVLIADRGIAGRVIGVAHRGVGLWRGDDRLVRVEAAAGESWDGLVERCVGEGLAGIECLAGIPGSVGATPVQNVGAYGQEVADCLEYVRVYLPAEDRVAVFAHSECALTYRDSIFKHALLGKAVILSVTFRLRSGPPAPVRYGELARALAERGGEPTLAEIREVVRNLRDRKGMLADASRPEGRSAGSFFTNPIVSVEEGASIRTRLEGQGLLRAEEAMPVHAVGPERIKLAAAWLIERAGIRKGQRYGGAAISPRHALAIVNHDNATAADVVGLAETVRARVRACAGVALTPEPVFLGFDETTRA